MSSKHLGEHEAVFVRELQRISAGRWLQPDASLAALDDDARVWIADRLDELLAALTPWSADDPLPSSLGVETTRSMHEAERRWRAAWERDEAVTQGASLRAFERAVASMPSFASGRMRKRRRAVEELARRATEAANQRLDDLSVELEEGSSVVPTCGGRTLTTLVTRHFEWIVTHGDAAPSPFGPLLEVWLRGAWPVMLPGDAVVIYVPIEHEGRVLSWVEGDPINYAPERASLAKHGPRRRPVAAERRTKLPTWWELGVSQPIVFDVRRYEVMTAGASFDVGDDPVEG